MRLRTRDIVASVLLALVINVAGLLLLVEINAHVQPQQDRAAVASRQIDFVKQRKKPRQRRLRTRVKRVVFKQPPLPVPNLPSAIHAPGLLMPEIQVAGMIQPVFEQEARQGARLILSEEQVDVPPKALHRIPPDYPEDAADRGVTGWVQLKLLVDRAGRVEQVHLLGAKPKGVFEQAAQRAIRRWIFSPARYRGATVSVWFRQKMIFRLD